MIGNINIINKRVAKALSLPESTIKSVNETYFKYLRKTLTKGEYINYYVRELGTFSSHLVGLRREIYNTIGVIRKLRSLPDKLQHLIENEQKATLYLRDLLKQYNILRLEVIRRQSIHKQKNLNKRAKLHQENTNDNQGILPSSIKEESGSIHSEI